MLDQIVSIWTGIIILGLAGLITFNKTYWRTQTIYNDFDMAEKIGLEGYGVLIQLISVLVVLGGFVGSIVFAP